MGNILIFNLRVFHVDSSEIFKPKPKFWVIGHV